FDFFTKTHAVYADIDYADATKNAVYSASLADGKRTLLSGKVSWVPIPETTRVDWIYGSARIGDAAYFTFLTTKGLELFRSQKPDEPLESLTVFTLPNNESLGESKLQASETGLAWYVQTASNNPLAFHNYGLLVTTDGKVGFTTL